VASNYTSAQTTTCGCCGGTMPAREIWEANREHAEDCMGGVDPDTGRCMAWVEDNLWTIETEDD